MSYQRYPPGQQSATRSDPFPQQPAAPPGVGTPRPNDDATPRRPEYRYTTQDPFSSPAPPPPPYIQRPRLLVAILVLTILNLVLVGLMMAFSVIAMAFGDPFGQVSALIGAFVLALGARSLWAYFAKAENLKEVFTLFGLVLVFFLSIFVIRDLSLVSAVEGAGAFSEQLRQELRAAVLIDLVFTGMGMANLVLVLLLPSRKPEHVETPEEEYGSTENVIVEKTIRD